MILLSGAVFLINEMLTVMLTNGQNICRSMNDSTIQVANERARPQRITQSVPSQRIINLDKPANDLLLLTTYQSATVSTQHLCFRPFSRHPLRHFPQSEACCQSLLPLRSPGRCRRFSSPQFQPIQSGHLPQRRRKGYCYPTGMVNI